MRCERLGAMDLEAPCRLTSAHGTVSLATPPPLDLKLRGRQLGHGSINRRPEGSEFVAEGAESLEEHVHGHAVDSMQ